MTQTQPETLCWKSSEEATVQSIYFFDGKPDRSNIPEKWLNEEVCVRFGFCGEEYASIVRDLTQHSRARAVF
jgi:hypothetical protein